MDGHHATARLERIREAYDPELLRKSGRVLVDRLASHLASALSGDMPVLDWRRPEANMADAATLAEAAPAKGREAIVARFTQLLETTLDRGIALGHPRYIGHQVPQPLPIASLFDAVASYSNQAMAVYEMGPWAMAVEQTLVRLLGSRIGWPAGTFSGIATSGGSLANFTALLSARNVALPGSWEHGVPRSGPAPVLVVHADAHYCVTRSAGMLGLGAAQVIRVGLDGTRRMDVERLDAVLADCRRRGVPIVAAVACGGATPTGAFDRIADVADCCRRHDVWLHVDAAHGGAVLLSDRHRRLLAGIDRADTVTWDAHKMLHVPALCAFLFHRDKSRAFATFQQEAPYLYDPTGAGMEEFDGGLKTVECSKRAMVLGLWAAWSIFGPGLLADIVETTFATARSLHARLADAPDFEPLHEPEANIVVFRHVPPALAAAAPEAVGRFQYTLRRRLVESGRAYVTATAIDGVGALRATVMNPLTSEDDLDGLLTAIRGAGQPAG